MSQSVYQSTITETLVSTQGPEVNILAFQGWYQQGNGSWQGLTCQNSQSLVTSGGYAQCCNSGATTCTNYWTSCDGTNPAGFPAGACATNEPCQTMSIFDQYPNPQASNLQIICAVSPWPASSIYRSIIYTKFSEVVATITASPSSPIATSTPIMTSAPASSSSSSTSLNDGTSNNGSSQSASKAWIAGVVIGPLAALAIVGLLIYFLRRNRSGPATTSNAYAPPPGQDHGANARGYGYGNDNVNGGNGAGNGYEYYSHEPKHDHAPHYAEAPQQQPVYEMPYSDPRHAAHELPQ